jgi:hypothetical protein
MKADAKRKLLKLKKEHTQKQFEKALRDALIYGTGIIEVLSEKPGIKHIPVTEIYKKVGAK